MTRMRKLLLLAVVCCGGLAATSSEASAADPVLYAAGDVACGTTNPNYNGGTGTVAACRQQATADLMVAGAFSAVLALGDLQYDGASLSDFQQSYDRSWGRFKAQTYPVIGNHEGTAATAGRGYCAYFGAVAHCNSSGSQGGAAFYSFNLGTWHIVVLNSNCAAAGGCDVGSAQYNWLRGDLAANPRACTLVAQHHARWSSGYDGSNEFMQPIWQLVSASGADLVLSGHSHNYERFAPIDGAGGINAATGMRQFVVGTGGAFFTGIGGGRAPGSEVIQNTSFGVLRLVLHPTSYDWSFIPASGNSFTDSGSQACRALPDTQAPSAPGNLTAKLVSPKKVNLAWAGSTDNVGVAGYEIWRAPARGALGRVGTTNATGSVDGTVAARRRYRYRVRARDAAGNMSALSNVSGVVTPGRRAWRRSLLARWRLKPARARRALARGSVRVRRRRWAPTVIRVRVDHRLAGRRYVHGRHAITVRLAAWSKWRRYRDRPVIVTIRRPLGPPPGASGAGGAAVAARTPRG
jgi:Calcineurin-like phosphoesterase